MGSSFVDLDATSIVVATERGLGIPFARYFIFRVQIYEKREKSSSVAHPSVGLTTAYKWCAVVHPVG